MPLCTRPYCQRQPRQPVGSLDFTSFENFQWREHANQMKIEGGEQLEIVRHFAIAQHIVDNQIVALPRHGNDGVPHAPQGSCPDRTGSDHDAWFVAVSSGFVGKTVRMVLQGFRQHVDERVHLDMQEGLGGYRLQRPGDRALAGAADTIEKNDLGGHARGALTRLFYRLRMTRHEPPTLCSFWQIVSALALVSAPILTA